ncbi:MAG TPA: oligosaccharide flippase family protein [Acidocella sp.]|jgi:PST family polysaccharide transporter|nr:oligosaccharide flippase family protein [Acidocella sp.]
MAERVESADAPPSGRRLAFGAGAMGMVSILKLGLQAASLPVMARLLGPSEIGVYALAVPVVAFVTMLADGGLGISLTREPESSRVWSTAFWVLLFTGVALSLLLTTIGFAEGYLIHQPRVPAFMAALSVTVVLMTVTVPSMARLDRQGRIAVGGFADLAANLCGVSIGVTLAFRGVGAWSLVAQYVSVSVVRAAIVNAVAFVKPKFEFYPHLLLTHLSAGGLVVGTRMADYFGRMVENLVVGQTLGTATLGRYAFSNQITRYVTEMVANPLWITLYIRALRSEHDEMPSLHLRFSRVLGVLLFPITAFAVVSAPMAVPLFLGPKWLMAIPLLQIMMPSYAMGLVGGLSGAILLARDRFGIQFYGQLGVNAGRVLAVCLGPWVGVIGVAWGITSVTTIYALFMLIIPATVTGSHPLPVLRNLAGPFLASLATALICWLCVRQASPSLERIMLAATLSGLTYLAANLLVDRARLTQDFRLLQQILFKKR